MKSANNLQPIIGKCIIGVCFVFASFYAYSTPKAPNGGSAPACWPPPCTIPIDGGISLLLAAGASFGAFKLLKREK